MVTDVEDAAPAKEAYATRGTSRANIPGLGQGTSSSGQSLIIYMKIAVPNANEDGHFPVVPE